MLEQAKKMGCTHLHLTGGEPLLRDDIVQVVRFASNLQLELRMQTNGELLTNDIAIALNNAGLRSVMISIDSWNPQTHNSLRGKGTHEKTITAIKTALSARLHVRLNSVITKHNCSEIFNTIIFAKSLGVRDYSAFYFSPIGSGRTMLSDWMSQEDYYLFWCNLKKALHQTNGLDNMNIVIEKGYADWKEAESIDTSSFNGCGGGCLNTYTKRDYLIVRCDGNVYPCILAIDGKPLGNIHEQRLEEIYSSSEIWDTMRPHGDEDCMGCRHYKLCGEGCRFYPSFNNQKKINHDWRCVYGKLVPLCPIMKYNTLNDSLGGSSDDVMVDFND